MLVFVLQIAMHKLVQIRLQHTDRALVSVSCVLNAPCCQKDRLTARLSVVSEPRASGRSSGTMVCDDAGTFLILSHYSSC